MKTILPIVILLQVFVYNFTIGQELKKCGSDELMEQLFKDPEFLKEFEARQESQRLKVATKSMNCLNTVIIPVAVHYSSDYNSSNFSCLRNAAINQINSLNDDFGGTNDDIDNYNALSSSCPTVYPPSALSTNSCIQFCLAQFNHPSCSSVSNGDYAITVGQNTWPQEPCWSGYLNIFVQETLSGGVAGIAPLNGGENPNGDGIVVEGSVFGGALINCSSGAALNNHPTYNLGRVVTHEVGHYFNLNHTFAGCSNGDNVADTPNQSTENFGCPSVNLSTCSSSAANTCGENDFFFNYMDYVDDACTFMFTTGQANRMYASANHNLWANVNVCGSEIAIAPIADFLPKILPQMCYDNNTVTFTDESAFAPTSWLWTFSGYDVTPTSSTDQNPTVTFNELGRYTISLTVTNSEGTDQMIDSMDVVLTSFEEPIIEIVCDDLNTANTGDDVFTYSINMPPNSSSTKYDINGDDSMIGLYYNEEYSSANLFNLSDAPLSLDIIDQYNAECVFPIEVNPDANCSTECLLHSYDLISVVCNDNGSDVGITDDFIEISLIIEGLNISSNYSISSPNGAILPTTGNYNLASNFTLTPNDWSSDIELLIVDRVDPDCTLSIITENTGLCSTPCTSPANNCFRIFADRPAKQ